MYFLSSNECFGFFFRDEWTCSKNEFAVSIKLNHDDKLTVCCSFFSSSDFMVHYKNVNLKNLHKDLWHPDSNKILNCFGMYDAFINIFIPKIVIYLEHSKFTVMSTKYSIYTPK